MKAALRRGIDRISRQYDELLGLSELASRRVERISGWSVGQHLDHLMKADRSIFGSFPNPDDGPLKPVSTTGRIVLWSGWIPRGKGRAPAATQPKTPESAALVTEVEGVLSLFHESLDPREALLEPQPIAKHPVFGGLNRAQWLRFVAVHHHHHAKIMRDVLRAHSS